MNTRKPARPARWPGLLLHFVCAAILASGLLSLPAGALTVSNTASVSYNGPDGPFVQPSNPVTVATIPAPTPSVLRFYQYAPGVTGASALPFDGGEYYDATTGTFVTLRAPQAVDGTPVNLASPVQVRETEVFHVGEPVFLVLTDANRNLDPAAREVIELRIITSTGDVETLRLQETGPDTGVFSAVISTVGAAVGVTQNDGRLTLGISTRLTGDYQDIWYPFDTAEADVLVDPFGIVFDAETGAPVDGVIITMIDVATGLPATVFGDDGTSAFPATLQTGGSAVDSSGFNYTFPPGGFRFPFVAPGNYRFVLQVPAGYTAPSAILPANLPDDPNGVPYAITTGSYGEDFVVVPGPALNIDVPIDPQRRTLVLQKTASQQEASAGDFLQYRLTLQNIDTAFAASAIDITDRLPFGLVYQGGSLRLNGLPQPDPAISADRRTLTIPVGDLAANASLQVTYVVMVGAGTQVGDAVNEASAAGNSGRRLSNLAQAAVRIREPLFSGRFTIIGRVFEGECNTPWDELKGVPNVRMLMEDGTYVVTDDDGQYHFEGVRPGTHVVQLDTDSLAPTQEPVSCIDNTRFGGTPYSQFVDVKGGGLWRADFHVRKRMDDVGIRVATRLETAEVAVAPAVPAPVELTFPIHFASCRTELDASAINVISRVIGHYQNTQAQRIEVTGHTDDQRLSPACAARYVDNHGLSKARARVVGDVLAREFGLLPEAVHSEGRGPDEPVASNATAEGRARNRRTEGRLHLKVPEPVVVAGDGTATVPHRTAVAGIAHDIEVDGSGPVRDLRVLALLPDGYAYDMSSTQVDGVPMAPPAIDGALLTFELGEVTSARPWRRVISFRVVPAAQSAQPAAADCPAGGYQVKALANVQPVTSARTQTPAAQSQVACPAPAADAPAGTGETTIEHSSEREQVQIEGVRARPVDPEREARRQARANIADTVTASGAHIDWFAGEQPGIAWRFPQPGYNPRSPVSRIVIKHAPEQTVSLRRANGEPVSALSFEGISLDATGTMAVSIWRAVSLEEGENRFVADVSDAGGTRVQQVEGTIVNAGMPVRAELVPEQSVLVADGIDYPVVAVRLFDRDGNRVRHGVTGAFSVNAPFVSREQAERQQNRQLAGLDRFQPGWQVEGDDGIAYIELAPTTETGALVLSFNFQTGLQGGGQYASRSQELRTWMEPAPRDWIVVGFAEGTLGHRTLKDNIQPLLAEGVDDGTWHDGQVSLYAKGRIRGEWLMTMAFDSDKRDERDRQKSLLSQIDPDEYYTLYGDGT
ncbi:MAG: OmpA family protein, partial [Gammaproteobacteria bacterium]